MSGGPDAHEHPPGEPAGQSDQSPGPAHDHAHAVIADTDPRLLGGALALILGFMAVEVVVGLIAGSLALLSDAAHMLTDAASIVLALIALRLAARPARGAYTFGLKRAEIVSAQVNGASLLVLVAYFTYEGIHRLVDPSKVQGWLVLATALVGIVVNLGASTLIARAGRKSLNVEGAYQHILSDLYAFIATAVAGLVLVLTGFERADAIAALVVAALMLRAGVGLLRDSGRVFLEAAPRGVDPAAIDADLHAMAGVVDVHDLHVWEVTSGFPALSVHLLVEPELDCHERRAAVQQLLEDRYGIDHSTVQVEHRDRVQQLPLPALRPDDPDAAPPPVIRPHPETGPH
jgi:cobalt-zinc-cadmium efflux system protein